MLHTASCITLFARTYGMVSWFSDYPSTEDRFLLHNEIQTNNIHFIPFKALEIQFWVDIMTTLCHEKQLCKVSFLSKLQVKSNGWDKNLDNMCTVTLTLKIWPRVKALVMDNILDEVSSQSMITKSYSLDKIWPWPWRCNLDSMSRLWFMENNKFNLLCNY